MSCFWATIRLKIFPPFARLGNAWNCSKSRLKATLPPLMELWTTIDRICHNKLIGRFHFHWQNSWSVQAPMGLAAATTCKRPDSERWRTKKPLLQACIDSTSLLNGKAGGGGAPDARCFQHVSHGRIEVDFREVFEAIAGKRGSMVHGGADPSLLFCRGTYSGVLTISLCGGTGGADGGCFSLSLSWNVRGEPVMARLADNSLTRMQKLLEARARR